MAETEQDTRTSTEIAAEAGGTVITAPGAVRVNSDTKFASERGIYRDAEGAERVVGPGQPIPAGWEHLRDAPLGSTRAAETVRNAEQQAAVGERGNAATDDAPKGGRRRPNADKAEKPGEDK